MAAGSDEAIERVCAKHLHQCFWLPENDSHRKLRITYSTTSNFANTSLPVVLFCSPMFGSRWMNLEFERLATARAVRVICVDRPGMGGSTQVPLDVRLQVWLETVPALLRLLKVEHVSLMSHSAGTLYCLNTMYHLRHILDPKQPYVAILGPWVHNEHSKVTMINMAHSLPNGMIDSWNSVGKFIQTRIMPTAAWSGGMLTAVSSMWKTGDADTLTPGQRFGTTDEIGKDIERLQLKYFFEEDTTAANEEFKLCLKKDNSIQWDVCDDYEQYVLKFCEQERHRREADASQPRLKLRVFYAASDVMIGKGGQTYFDKCWNQSCVSEVIDFDSTELIGTDHDSVLVDQKKGALEGIFAEIATNT